MINNLINNLNNSVGVVADIKFDDLMQGVVSQEPVKQPVKQVFKPFKLKPHGLPEHMIQPKTTVVASAETKVDIEFNKMLDKLNFIWD